MFQYTCPKCEKTLYIPQEDLQDVVALTIECDCGHIEVFEEDDPVELQEPSLFDIEIICETCGETLLPEEEYCPNCSQT